MIVAASVGLASRSGLVLLIFAAVAAVVAGGVVWRRGNVRETWLRATLVTLRAALLLGIGLALADPVVTREVTRKPRLAVVWDPVARLDVADAPDGATRRDVLARAERTAPGLDERFERVEAGAPADATLFVTDGASPADALASFAGRVAALVPARDATIPDLAVVDVTAPPHAAAGAAIPVEVTLRATSAAGARAVVTLSDEAHVLASATRDVATNDELTTISLAGTLQGPGWQRLVVEVAGVTGERETANNRYETWVDVDATRREVLFLESEPSWEGKFVRRALEDDPTFHVDYVARVSRAAELAQPGQPTPPASTPTDPAAPKPPAPTPSASVRAAVADAARLARYDAVILGPLDASELGEADVTRLAAFVSARGGGLVVLGGNAYAGSILAPRGPLAPLLPAAILPSSLGPRERDTTDAKPSVLLRPTASAGQHPAFAALGADPAAAIEKLQRLDGDYLKLGALKPGAIALAEDASARTEAKPTLVAAQPYGDGRVVLVAPQDTWRLAVGAPTGLESASARFWTGLVAWSAAGAEAPVTLRLGATRVAAGEPLRAELVARTAAYEPERAIHVSARAERDGAESIPADFSPSPDAPGLYVAEIRLSSAGTWTVTADASGEPATATVEVVEPSEADRARPDPIRAARFDAAVRERGGAIVASDHAADLVVALGAPEPERREESSHLARSPWWGLALLVVFCTEIFLRRRFGVD